LSQVRESCSGVIVAPAAKDYIAGGGCSRRQRNAARLIEANTTAHPWLRIGNDEIGDTANPLPERENKKTLP